MPNTAQILLVEPHEASRASLHALACGFGNVESFATFEEARARLASAPVDFLVTNVRLGAYNGLHLVYLSRLTDHAEAPRAIVYDDGLDVGLAREAQRAGAFYEDASSLPASLAAYIGGALPGRDRRDPADLTAVRRLRDLRRRSDVPREDVPGPAAADPAPVHSARRAR
jgi:DNA-binding NtrC family response regulator